MSGDILNLQNTRAERIVPKGVAAEAKSLYAHVRTFKNIRVQILLIESESNFSFSAIRDENLCPANAVCAVNYEPDLTLIFTVELAHTACAESAFSLYCFIRSDLL